MTTITAWGPGGPQTTGDVPFKDELELKKEKYRTMTYRNRNRVPGGQYSKEKDWPDMLHTHPGP